MRPVIGWKSVYHSTNMELGASCYAICQLIQCPSISRTSLLLFFVNWKWNFGTSEPASRNVCGKTALLQADNERLILHFNYGVCLWSWVCCCSPCQIEIVTNSSKHSPFQPRSGWLSQCHRLCAILHDLHRLRGQLVSREDLSNLWQVSLIEFTSLFTLVRCWRWS